MLLGIAFCLFFICCSLWVGTEPVSADYQSKLWKKKQKNFELISLYKCMLLLIVEVRNILSAGTQYFDDNEPDSEMKITPLSLGKYF